MIKRDSHSGLEAFHNEERTIGVPLTVDGHVDLPYYMMRFSHDLKFSELKEAPFTINKAKRVGLRLFFTAIYCEDKFNGKESMHNFEKIYNFTVDRLDKVSILRQEKEVDQLVDQSDLLGTVFLLENADFLADEPFLVEDLREKGFIATGLTHAGRNRLADGNSVSHSDGITGEGMAVIRNLTLNNMLVDVAHLHEKCFWQLLDLLEGNIISSHTGIREIFDIPRNLTLDQAQEIIQRGGVIGLAFNPEMISAKAIVRVEHIFAHIDAFVQRFGPDGVGLGSDFCGFDKTLEDGKDITSTAKLRDMMLSHGYGYSAIEKIMGANWIGLLKKYLR